ncbi:MAG: hypothetical protein JXR96_02510, partial [Deltaproteobacteria bacterium]|nr:hypothetical protein [Deltaproteobacteria bacterium]
QSTISMLNPMVVLGIILRIPRHYLGVVAVWGLGSLLDIFLMSCIRAMLARVDIPVITPLLVTSLGLLIPLFIALVMGRVIYQNGEIFGLVRKSDLMVPVMPDAVPGES